jgi:hypothetical protein
MGEVGIGSFWVFRRGSTWGCEEGGTTLCYLGNVLVSIQDRGFNCVCCL